MAEAGRPRLFQLLRRADQRACARRAPAPCHRPMAAHAAASWPKRSNLVGADDDPGGCMAPETEHPPSLAQRALCRHTPKVGAVCGKAARTDLGGGRAMKRASLPLLRRREFLRALGSSALAIPVPGLAQTLPMVGFFINGRADGYTAQTGAFRRGLHETGFREGENVTIAYRWTDGYLIPNPRIDSRADTGPPIGSGYERRHCPFGNGGIERDSCRFCRRRRSSSGRISCQL